MSYKYFNALAKIIVALAFGAIYSYGATAIKSPYLDALFLDLKSYLTRSEFGNSEVVAVSISDIKEALKGAKDTTKVISASTLAGFISSLQALEPRLIVLALRPRDITGTATEINTLLAQMENIPTLYLYSRWGQPGGETFASSEIFGKFPRQTILKLSMDSAIGPADKRIRRFLLSMDGKSYDENLMEFAKIFDLKLPPLDSVPGTLSIFDSTQVYIKYYDIDSMRNISAKESLSVNLPGKIVFVGTNDAHSSMMSLHPFSRFDFDEQASSRIYFSEPLYLSTVYENIRTLGYIQEPSKRLNMAWIGVCMTLNILLILVYGSRPLRYMYLSFFLMFMVFTIGVLVHKSMALNFDLTRVLAGTFLVQYFGIPLMFLKFLRTTDREQFLAERNRANRRSLVKFAKADLALKIAAKVAHDLRGPVMALQVSSSLVKGKISEDVESLIRDATLRISYIAEDTLQSYRGKASSVSIETEVKEVLEDLLTSYRHLYPNLDFSLIAEEKIYTQVPFYGLQRAISNILNNAVDAMATSIQISMKVDSESIRILVCNNGVPVPAEAVENMFKEKATYGKSAGTGLGLYQVRTEIESYGGSVQLNSETVITTFEVQIPKILSTGSLIISGIAIILDSYNEIPQKIFQRYQSVSVTHHTSVESAWTSIRDLVHTEDATILIDITFDDGNQSALDLLEKIQGMKFFKIILYCSMVDNPEIQKLAADFHAALIDKSILVRTL